VVLGEMLVQQAIEFFPDICLDVAAKWGIKPYSVSCTGSLLGVDLGCEGSLHCIATFCKYFVVGWCCLFIFTLVARVVGYAFADNCWYLFYDVGRMV